LDERRAEFRTVIDRLNFDNSGSGSRDDKRLAQNGNGACRTATCGTGRILVGDLETLLTRTRVQREPMVDFGLEFIRRTHSQGYHYFVTHQGDHAIDGWITLATSVRSAAIMDPMSGQVAMAAIRQQDGQSQVYLQLEPKRSLILRTFTLDTVNGPQWPYVRRTGEATALHNGTSAPIWKVTFLEGGPVLPAAVETQTLDSWTKMGDLQTARFAGTARYTCTFDRPSVDGMPVSWQLNLGRVEQSAHVRLNGQDLGTMIQPPFTVRMQNLKRTGNVLAIDVTNLAANRIRDLDRRGVEWKRFHDINFVSIDYKPFDASDAPIQDSGLIGPVTLAPLRRIDPNADY